MDPGPQHRQGKGFGDVVVRPQLQPRHDIRLQVVGGQQDHRRPVSPISERTQQVQAVAVGQVDVQDQEGKRVLCQNLTRLSQGRRMDDRAGLSLQGDFNSVS